ncbi:LamB/YcsF family protein [Thiotrichales bacterium 19S11-10]|nr:LamB/YcsF family protein [Thiotrichales bacterium 19S11-10]MCF6808048.1 LamB/YcsF family protein [Thiotrichales bacterium 19S9-11]MCF6812063.1 LamB/YcsF family protein [Thiotrichales bacterium 19S9-12]
MLINCDIGERGESHPVDQELLRYVDIVNIACGGHAGDEASVSYYSHEARRRGIMVTAHLSYPDPENFGREEMDISNTDLAQSLSEQLSMFHFVRRAKLHGALYHKANSNLRLALFLARWFSMNGIEQVIVPEGSLLATACERLGVNCLYEAFLERRYHLRNDQIELVPREKHYACIDDPEEALSQYEDIKAGYVKVYRESRFGKLATERHLIQADTVCIHSDSPIALPLIYQIKSQGSYV